MVFASVVILEINTEDVALIAVFETEGQPPVAADRHRKSLAQVAPLIASSIKLMRL